MRTLTDRFALVLGLLVGGAFVIPSDASAIALTILTPSAGQTVSGVVTFSASADAAGIASLQFHLDGKPFGASVTTGACRATWATTVANDGPHQVQAVAKDAIGTAILSKPVSFTVQTPAPGPPPTPTPIPGQVLTSFVLNPPTVHEGESSQATARDGAGVVLNGVTWGFDKDFIGAVSATGLITGATLTMLPNAPFRDTDIKATFAGVTKPATLRILRGAAPPPPPPPPQLDPCVLDPLVPIVSRWPSSPTGSRSFSWNVGTKSITSVVLTWTPTLRATFTDARKCPPVTVIK